MIGPSKIPTRISVKILTLQFSLDVERWMAQYLLTRVSVKILTLRFSLDMER